MGTILAAVLGIALAMYWSFVGGVVIGAVVLVLFIIAACLKEGPGWTYDEDEDRW